MKELLSLINYLGSFLLWLLLVSINTIFVWSIIIIIPMAIYFFLLIFKDDNK